MLLDRLRIKIICIDKYKNHKNLHTKKQARTKITIK